FSGACSGPIAPEEPWSRQGKTGGSWRDRPSHATLIRIGRSIRAVGLPGSILRAPRSVRPGLQPRVRRQSWGHRMKRAGLPWLLALSLAGAPARGADDEAPVILENEVLRLSLSRQDASLSVTDKRIGLVWPQKVAPGFRVVAG